MPSRPTFTEAGKVAVECPKCGFVQKESVFAQNTLCRRCSYQIALSKPEKAAKESGLSFFKRFGKVVNRERPRQVRCYKCGAGQTVSSAAKSTFCPKCTQYIDLRDHKIASSYSRNIETQGAILVTSKGDLGSARASCQTATIQGRLRGNLFCSGTAEFKLKGRVYGAIHADHLVIERRSNIEFARPVKVRTAEIRGRTYARITAENVVTITRSGWLEGVVYAKSITVEKGGIFSGELFIGRQELEQPELLPEEGGGLFEAGGEKSLAPG